MLPKLSELTLLSHDDFSLKPNAATGAAGSTTAWGANWIDVPGGFLSVTGGLGYVGNDGVGTYPFVLVAEYAQQLENPLMVVKGFFTSSTSGGPANTMYAMLRYTATADNIYAVFQPYGASNNLLDVQGTGIGENIYAVTALANVPFYFVFGVQAQDLTRSTYWCNVYSDAALTQSVFSFEGDYSSTIQQGLGSLGFSAYFNGMFYFQTIDVYDIGYFEPPYQATGIAAKLPMSVPALATGTRSDGTATYSGANTIATVQSVHTPIIDGVNLRPLYLPTGQGDALLPNDLTMQVSVAFPIGNTRVPAYLNSNPTPAVGTGSVALFDPVPLFIPAGSPFNAFTATTIPADGAVPITYNTDNTGNTGYVEGTTAAVGNQTRGTGTLAQDYNQRFGPSNFLTAVIEPLPFLVCLGDSKTRGHGAVPWCTLAIEQLGKFGYLNMGQDGEFAHAFVDPATASAGYYGVLKWATHVVWSYGANDVTSGGGSFARLMWYAQRARAFCLSQGVQFIPATLTPVGVTSTDGFITEANQIVSPYDSVRQPYNAAIRAGVLGSTIMELAKPVESVVTPGKWAVDTGGVALTSDGTHESQAGANLQVANAFAVFSQLTIIAGGAGGGSIQPGLNL